MKSNKLYGFSDSKTVLGPCPEQSIYQFILEKNKTIKLFKQD